MGDSTRKRKAIIVGISGASSSGKTTLARLLRDIFPNTFILHEDDFYRAENELPTRDGLLDWDCAEALNIPDMERALEYIRAEGTFPPFVDSKEDQNSVGACPVSEAKIEAVRSRVQTWLQPGQPGHKLLPPTTSSSSSSSSSSSPLSGGEDKLRICILDGFLLYSPLPQFRRVVSSLLDVKLFLLVSREKATARREARDGYVTLEGFWKDPPGYVEKVVWPNYVESHAWLFQGGDVEAGVLDQRVLRQKGISAQQTAQEGEKETEKEEEEEEEGEGGVVDVDMESTFEWLVDTMMAKLGELVVTQEEKT